MIRAYRFFVPVFAAVVASATHAASFEAVGTVRDIQLGRNIVVVDRTTYSLPGKTLLGGSPAIFQLKPGHLIGFSGTEATPHPIIDSLYLYPESSRIIEQGGNLP